MFSCLLLGALGHCPSNEILLVGMLVTSDGLLPDNEMMELWNQTLQQNPSSILLHRAYVQYRTNNFASFDIKVFF